MANDCLPSIQACAMRVARLNAAGVPAVGADNMYVTAGLITLTATPEYRDGDEFEVVTACGDLGVNFRDRDRLRRLGVELNVVAPDPEFTEMLAGGEVLTDGAAVGWAAPALLTAPTDYGVSIELWSKRIGADGAIHPTLPYYRWVLPRGYYRVGAKNFQNGPMDNPFSGFAVENAAWGTGPVYDWPETVESGRVLQYLPVAASDLPTAECGYQPIVADV